MIATVPRTELAPGYSIARVLNGGWQLAADHGAAGGGGEAVLDGLERLARAGFTTFDCADIYVGVEELLGALRRRLGPATPIEVHTKYVPDRDELGRLGAGYVARAIDRSLARLGVERLDLVQFHWWDFAVPGWVEAAGWLAGLVERGKIRHLGVTNFDARRLGELLAAGVPVVSNQVQYSLLDRRPEGALAGLCESTGVRLLAYGTLAGGFLSGRWLGAPPPERSENRSQTKYRLIVEEAGGWPALERLLAALAPLAARHGVGPAALAARWVLDRTPVAGVILGARDAAHLEENLRLATLELDAAGRAELEAAAAGVEPLRGEIYDLERTPGGRHARILRTGLRAEPGPGGVRSEGPRSDRE